LRLFCRRVPCLLYIQTPCRVNEHRFFFCCSRTKPCVQQMSSLKTLGYSLPNLVVGFLYPCD
jgi:hypothetical protein